MVTFKNEKSEINFNNISYLANISKRFQHGVNYTTVIKYVTFQTVFQTQCMFNIHSTSQLIC